MSDSAAVGRGLGHALRIQRAHAPREWPAQLALISDPEERAVADGYLRGIAARQRAVIELARQKEERERRAATKAARGWRRPSSEP